MINKARKKFILWAMIAMTAIVVILTAAVNIVNYNLTDRNLSVTLKELAEEKSLNGPKEGLEEPAGAEAERQTGKFAATDAEPQEPESTGDRYGEKETGASLQDGQKKTDKDVHGRTSAFIQYKNRYFFVILDRDRNLIRYSPQNDLISEEEAQDLAAKAYETGKKEGYLNEYKYLVYEEENGNTMLCFLDCATNFRAIDTLLLVSVIVGAAGILLGFLFILFMSGKTVEPVRISIEKQKQFITNAGHELKTPLSAIATNMDILTMDFGENEWVDGTKKQVRKLRKLVESMVALSRMEEENLEIRQQSFSLSGIARECADGFLSIARMRGKEMEVEITEGLTAQGDPGMIQQMISILCDNALKYAAGTGPVRFCLRREGRHAVFFTSNPWEHDVDEDQLETLFDRFYRGDPARASETKSAGHGLGLSIARAIAQKNMVRLTASLNEQGEIVFRAVFPKETL